MNMMAKKEEGFKISLDDARAILKVQVWGLWGMNLAEQYRKKFEEQNEKIKTSEKEWHLLIDVTEYPPQLPEIQSIINDGLVLLEDHKIKKRAILVNGTITQLQTESLTSGAGIYIYSYFRSESDAVRWLLSDMNS